MRENYNYWLNSVNVENRQKSWGLLTDRLEISAENRAYWLGHILEEVLEVFSEDYDTDKFFEEVADVLIFSQNYASTLPNRIDLSFKTTRSFGGNEYIEPLSITSLLLDLRRCDPTRKDWKTYNNDLSESFQEFWNNFVKLLCLYDLDDSNDFKRIDNAYRSKLVKNAMRSDWSQT